MQQKETYLNNKKKAISTVIQPGITENVETRFTSSSIKPT